MKWFLKYLLLSLLLFGAVWFLYSCRENPEESISLAAVGEETFSLWDLRHYFPENTDSLDRVRALRVMSKWVDQTILYQAALDEKVDQDERVQTLLENARRKILVDQLLNRVRAQIEEPREGEIVEYYQKNQGEFRRNYPVYKVLYIREEGGRKAWDLRDDIKRRDFDRVYSKVTGEEVDQSQIEFVPAKNIPQCLHEDLEKLEPGRTGWPKKCDDDYMILHLYDISPAGESFPLEKVRSEVVERIMSEKAEIRVASFLDSLKTISVVFTYPENLPGGKAAMMKAEEKLQKENTMMKHSKELAKDAAPAEVSESGTTYTPTPAPASNTNAKATPSPSAKPSPAPTSAPAQPVAKAPTPAPTPAAEKVSAKASSESSQKKPEQLEPKKSPSQKIQSQNAAAENSAVAKQKEDTTAQTATTNTKNAAQPANALPTEPKPAEPAGAAKKAAIPVPAANEPAQTNNTENSPEDL